MPLRHTHTLTGAAVSNIRSLTQVPVDTAGAAAAATAAAASWLIGVGNEGLFKIVLVAMFLDILVGAIRAVDDPLQHYSSAKLFGGLVGKLFRLLFIPTAALVDRLLLIEGPFNVSTDVQATFPVATFAMWALAAAELTSILNKFRDGGIAPELIAEVIRLIDRKKLGAEPPARRHYDLPAIVSELERTEKQEEEEK